jgi:hypothetical protein
MSRLSDEIYRWNHQKVSGSCCEKVLGSINWLDPHQHLVNFSDGGNIKMFDTSQYYPILLNTSQYYKLASWPALIARLDLIKLSLYMTRYSSF